MFASVMIVVAEASNPPPDTTPTQDVRPAHWVEMAKNGDAWILSKDGILAFI